MKQGRALGGRSWPWKSKVRQDALDVGDLPRETDMLGHRSHKNEERTALCNI